MTKHKHNNVQMNMSKKEVEDKLGKEKRITSNEYGTNWYTYYDTSWYHIH
jgi:hypothetical protein